MAETADLPEEIILNIFSRLPVKSLIRFTTVSKHLHFIILSDPKFAQSHLKAARRLSRRLLVSTDAPQLESLPLDAAADDTPSFGDPSSVRKLTLPFLHHCRHVQLMGSCNGLVFLTAPQDSYFIWNPSLGFIKKLPDPSFCVSSRTAGPGFYGVGHVSATDDYKVLISSVSYCERALKVELFSLRTHIWERIEPPCDVGFFSEGTFSNDALHWLNYRCDIACFDLVVKEFRRMRLPDFDNDGKSFSQLGVRGGCLCVLRYLEGACDSVDFWVMRDYGVSESWTMLFSLKVSHPYEWCISLLVLENITVVAELSGMGFELKRIDHKGDQKVGKYKLQGGRMCMVEYEESLLWISEYHPVQETEQVQILETDQKASGS